MTKRDNYFRASWARVFKNQNGEEEKDAINDGEQEKIEGKKIREED